MNRPRSKLCSLPIEYLGLSAKSRNALLNVGISSVGDLFNSARIPGLEPEDCGQEINRAFRALLQSATRTDWGIYRATYAQECDVTMLPNREARVWSGHQFIQEFPRIVEEIVRLEFGPRHSLVVRQRTLKSSNNRWTLERIGNELGVSRQRIRVVEKRIIETLRRSLLEQDYRRFRFRISPAFVEPLVKLQRGLKNECKSGRRIKAESWAKAVRRAWRMKVEDIGDNEPLILEILRLRLRE